MLNIISLAMILLAGVYLLWLGSLSLAAPARATDFLGRFAGSARAHYLELLIRMAVGLSLLQHAPQMRLPDLFTVAGWVLVVTTVLLFAVPWRWHHRIAQLGVPYATGNLRLFGLASALLGIFVLGCIKF